MSHIDLDNVTSSALDVSFFSRKFNKHSVPAMDVFFDGLFNAENIISTESNFHIEKIIENLGKITSFSDATLIFTEVNSENSLDNVSLDDFYGAVNVVNYKESIRYEVISGISTPNIRIPYDIIFLGKKHLVDSTFDIIRISGSVSKTLYDSWYPSILKDAVRAKILTLKQLFFVGRQNKVQVLFMDALFEGIISAKSFPVLISEFSFFGKIIFPEKPKTIDIQSLIPLDYTHVSKDFSMSPVTTDLSDVFFGPFYLSDTLVPSVYSSPVNIRISGVDKQDAVYGMTKQHFDGSTEDFVSDTITVVKLLAPDGEYRVMSLEDFISNEIKPSIAIYSDGNLSVFEDELYSFAKWNDYKFLDNGIYGEFDFRISIELPQDLQTETYDGPQLNIYMVDRALVDLDDYRSYTLTIEAGSNTGEYINSGLYRSMYVYDFGLNPYVSSAWYRPGSHIIKIAPWNFIAISPHGLFGNVKKIMDTKYNIILLSWERRPVLPYHYMVPEINMPDYYIIKKIDNSDFVIISLSSSGGSILHMHKKGTSEKYTNNLYISPSDDILLGASEDTENIANPHLGESAAREISSSRYTRYAKVMYDVMNGITYSGRVVQDATKYISDNERHALFFEDFEYNPYQLKEIIVNKNEEAVKDSFFEPVEILEHDGIKFIHKEDDLSGSDNISVGRVLGNISRVMSDSVYTVATLIDAVNIGVDSLYLNIVEGCGNGSFCSNKAIGGQTASGYSVFGIVKYYSFDLTVYGDRKEIEYPEQGYIDIEDGYYNMYSPYILNKLQDVVSDSTNLQATIGTWIDGLLYDGSLRYGLFDFDSVNGSPILAKIRVMDVVLDDAYSDFYFKLDTSYNDSTLSSYHSVSANFGIDEGRFSLEDAFTRVESVWMKVFFPQRADGNTLEKTIMKFLVSSGDFSKVFSLPYYYVDEVVDGIGRRVKEGDHMIGEDMSKTIKLPGSEAIAPPEDLVCGPEPEMTYLEYEGFSHILNYNDGSVMFGNYTKREKENMNSPYLKIMENSVTMPGMTLTESAALAHTVAESILSHIEDLSVVYDWNIENFELDKDDLFAYAHNSSNLEYIDEAFASSIKFIISTLGEEQRVLAELRDEGMFPEFPEIPKDDHYLDSHEVNQYIAVVEKDEEDV